MLNIVLWVAGVGLLAFGYARARAPYARYRAQLAVDANLRRYEDWRGGRRGEPGEVTGADIMRGELRRQVQLWGAVAIAGVVLIFLGFLIR